MPQVNLLIEDEDDDMQRDENEEDEMEGDENEDDDEEDDELEDDVFETLSDDSDNNEEHEFENFENMVPWKARTMVKGKHSKPRPRSTNASGSMSSPTNAIEFTDLSIHQQIQQEFNDVPFETLSLLGASAEQVENETPTHDSCSSPSIDLGASVDDTSSRSRGRGPSVGL
ncbi:Uncharacterized protein TCM_028515 [Theobroma cacao]|uniref:Uncharacterized protein n=1 Tax=Theobroma cacao TaxID=3641 RepID=A0A061GAN3_THECC|nr:Uncharacterized protein TCM_028515 [Theobroma cacao]